MDGPWKVQLMKRKRWTEEDVVSTYFSQLGSAAESISDARAGEQDREKAKVKSRPTLAFCMR